MEKTAKVLTYFKTTNEQRTPMEEVIFNTREYKGVKGKKKIKKYDAFPFNKIGTILMNTLFKLIKKDDPFLNEILAEANFGFKFGEYLLLEYEFLKHCIDNNIEGLVLIDTFVKKNEIRLNTF